jgi:hypothetical protein
MMTRKILCLLALPAFLICGEAAAKSKGGAPKLATSVATNGSMAKQTTGAVRTAPRQPNKVGGSCPPWACGSDSNGPQLTGIQGDTVQELDKLATNGTKLSGLQAASGLITVNTVILASGEAIALR